MSYEEEKNRHIRVGNAGNIAAELLSGIGARGDVTTQQVADLFADLHNSVLTVLMSADADLQNQLGATPVAQANQAIPAAVPQAAPVAAPGPAAFAPVQQAAEPFPAAQAAPQVQQQAPAPVPGVADGDPVVDGLWRAFFNDPTAWYDNRVNKKNPKGPDFKSKNIPQADNPQYMAGLWLKGKDNPSWVPAALQQAGY